MAKIQDILQTILTMRAEKVRTVCVFDLDSTLFNVSTRTQKILHEFAAAHTEAERKADLLKIEIHPREWGLKESLTRAGFKIEEHMDLHQSLRDFWVERFFTNEYLHYDVPYKGAVYFVQRLHQLGLPVKYLTGRDVARMGRGTLEVLLKWGFPVLEGELHLKPHRSMNDEEFKYEWVRELAKDKDLKIFFFENEPVNINAIGRQLPDIKIVYMNTTHSRREEVDVPAIEIQDFSLNGFGE